MEVKCATSFDERFDPSNVLNEANASKFWVTTGLYPQEILLELKAPKSLQKIKFVTTGGM